MGVSLQQVLTLSAVLFASGLYVVLTRPNAIAILMGVELILNAAGMNFAAFNHFIEGGVQGTLFTVFIIVLAAAEAAIALAIVLAIYQNIRNVDATEMDELRL